MSTNFFEPLVLDNIPFNFAIIFPVNGRDTLCIYNNRKFALKAYGYFQSNPKFNSEKNISHFILRSMGLGHTENKINFITSDLKYQDITNKDDRTSHLIFSWEGVSNKFGYNDLIQLFHSTEETVYSNFKEWIRLKDIERQFYNDASSNKINTELDIYFNKIENIERDLEESISVLTYQGERVSRSIQNKNKSTKRMTIAFLLIYFIFITSFLIARYIL